MHVTGHYAGNTQGRQRAKNGCDLVVNVTTNPLDEGSRQSATNTAQVQVVFGRLR